MTDPFEMMLEDYLPNVKAISDVLRAEIHKAAPQAVETFNPEQKHLTYSVSDTSGSELIVLSPKKDYVLLVFKDSNQLQDPQDLLGGEGKHTRFMTVRTVEEANSPALSELFENAWSNAVAQKPQQ